jgi:hypothetical protein
MVGEYTDCEVKQKNVVTGKVNDEQRWRLDNSQDWYYVQKKTDVTLDTGREAKQAPQT